MMRPIPLLIWSVLATALTTAMSELIKWWMKRGRRRRQLAWLLLAAIIILPLLLLLLERRPQQTLLPMVKSPVKVQLDDYDHDGGLDVFAVGRDGIGQVLVNQKGDLLDLEWHYAPELIIDLKDDTTDAEIKALEKSTGLDLVLNSVHSAKEKLMRAVVKRGSLESIITRLKKHPDVEIVEPNYLYFADMTPNDPRYPEQWHMKMIGMEEAWDVTRGAGVVVAVIDTGIAYEDYREFKQAQDLGGTKFVKGYNFVEDTEHANDDHGHGTHVAGTIAQTTNNHKGVTGVAFEASLMPLKVLNKYGMGTAADIADAIRFAADKGAKVINMSLGSPAYSRVMESAVKYAHKKGVTIVCAAGNTRSEGKHYPAAFPHCIAVSAVGPDGELAPYSTWGNFIDIAAPGGDKQKGEQYGVLQNTIIDGRDDYYFFQGTSMAAPHVSGTAALVISLGVTDPDEVEAILKKTATKKADAKKYGAGILNAAAAVKAADSRWQIADARYQMPDEIHQSPATGHKAQVTGHRSRVTNVDIPPLLIPVLRILIGVFGSLAALKFLKRKVYQMFVPKFSVGFTLGLIVGSCGLFFLAYVPAFQHPWLAWLWSGVPDWADLGRHVQPNPIFHSALIPFLGIAFLSGWKQMRDFLAGLSFGVAAHLVIDAFLLDIPLKWLPGVLGKLWLLVNAFFSFTFGYGVWTEEDKR